MKDFKENALLQMASESLSRAAELLKTAKNENDLFVARCVVQHGKSCIQRQMDEIEEAKQ